MKPWGHCVCVECLRQLCMLLCPKSEDPGKWVLLLGWRVGGCIFLPKSVSFCGNRSWQNGMFRDFQDLKPISSGQIFINWSLQIFSPAKFVEGFHGFHLCVITEVVISCGMSSSKWMRQMAFWQSWNRPKERKSGAKLRDSLEDVEELCGFFNFCQQKKSLVFVCLVPKKKARPEFQVIQWFFYYLIHFSVGLIPIPFFFRQSKMPLK